MTHGRKRLIGALLVGMPLGVVLLMFLTMPGAWVGLVIVIGATLMTFSIFRGIELLFLDK